VRGWLRAVVDGLVGGRPRERRAVNRLAPYFVRGWLRAVVVERLVVIGRKNKRARQIAWRAAHIQL
jgi:hypothetical protein